MKPLDLSAVSLAPAVTLIEASAGTGKTYSITGLMVRLLLERDIEIGQIVAVTFTEAATQELRERVRQRIVEALRDLRAGTSTDPILQGFLQNLDVPAGVRRLDRALLSFDEAQISTIHGFCQRSLGDYAFESGAPFAPELVADPTPLFTEVARDFWRRTFYESHPLAATVALAWEQSPEQWVKLLYRAARHPELVIIPPPESTPAADLIALIEERFLAVRREWHEHGTEVRQLLQNDKRLSRAKDEFTPARVATILAQLKLACEQPGSAPPASLRALAEVCSEAIAKGKKKQSEAPTHRFFELCSDFCASVSQLLNRLTHEFLTYARAEVPRRKARSKTVTYDDLIIGLRDALRGTQGASLADLIGQRYQAALIDEFQDTDPAQYEIFRRIFGTGKHCLFYIGDPKQSIYGFRGADIFTYSEAAAAVQPNAFTLTTNWRSEPRLLLALNTLFQGSERPFVFDWIGYHEVQAPAAPKVAYLTAAPANGAALRLRHLPDVQGGRGLNQEAGTKSVIAQVAADLAALHASGAGLSKRALRFSDLAVLVRTNEQAESIQQALRAAGIRSILQTETNVFAAAEAGELQEVLQAVLEPRRNGILKAALATSLFGLDAAALAKLHLSATDSQQWLERFLGWQQQWVDGCFIAMFRRLLVEQAGRARLVRLPGGERRLTNYLQLAELLHEAESAGRLSPDAVCGHLITQRAVVGAAEKLHQIRLESDQDSVHIVTVHKAKGLEYPVVFCPFLWKPAESSNHTELLFHDREHENRLTCDIREKKNGASQHQQWASEEARSEELRLTYVALTRAMNRCYVYIPETKTIGQSPCAHLLGIDGPETVADGIRRLVEASKGTIDVWEVTELAGTAPAARAEIPVPVEARRFTGKIPRVALTASFTGLNTDIELDEQAADWIESEPAAPDAASPANQPTIFTFPRGAKAGDFFHDVLENVSFEQTADLELLVQSKLQTHGFTAPEYAALICTNLRNLLGIELEPGLRLGALRDTDMIREMEFTHPLRIHARTQLSNIFAQTPDIDAPIISRMERLQFRPVEGFMRGFIDLLFRWRNRFYIIDWKSNWLGARTADYHPARLQAEMLKKNYYLQYHLYTLAVDLFLRARVPGYHYDRDFGGIYYIFLRGLDAQEPAHGIFRDRPSATTLASLRGLLP